MRQDPIVDRTVPRAVEPSRAGASAPERNPQGRVVVLRPPGQPALAEIRARIEPGLLAGDPGEYICLHCGRAYALRSTRDRHMGRCAKRPQPEGG